MIKCQEECIIVGSNSKSFCEGLYTHCWKTEQKASGRRRGLGDPRGRSGALSRSGIAGGGGSVHKGTDVGESLPCLGSPGSSTWRAYCRPSVPQRRGTEQGRRLRSSETEHDDSKDRGGKEDGERDATVLHKEGAALRAGRARDGDRGCDRWNELPSRVAEKQHLSRDEVGQRPPLLKVWQGERCLQGDRPVFAEGGKVETFQEEVEDVGGCIPMNRTGMSNRGDRRNRRTAGFIIQPSSVVCPRTDARRR